MTYKLLISISIVFLGMSCQPKTASYLQEMETYRDKLMKEYKQNTHLKLSPEELSHISHYPIDSDYRVVCDYAEKKDSEHIVIPTYAKTEKAYTIHGTATCKVNGESITLQLYQSTQPHIPKNYLFLPVMDLTNGDTTYGGGRYIEMTTDEIKDGQVILDFNKLYNPYCAFRDGFFCPIPPVENHLDIALPVGEKAFDKH